MWGVSGRKQLNSDILGFQQQGTHSTGKTGKMAKKSLSGNTQGIWIFYQNTENTGNLACSGCNFLILKVYVDICSENIQISFLKLDKSAKSVLCM